MAYASTTYPANGVLETFAVPFPYLQKSDVNVTLNGVATLFTWDNDSTVRVSPAPALGLVVGISRVTDLQAKAVDFVDGTVLTEASLDTSADQFFYLIQEVRDDFDALEAGAISGTTIDTITQNTIDGVLASSTIVTLQNDIATAQATADGKIESFYATEMPGSGSEGDFWIDTDDGNKLYRHNGTTFVEIQDDAIQQALLDAGTAQATADGKIVTFYQTGAPTGASEGDLWIDTDDDNRLYRWDSSGAGQWVDVASTAPIGATVFHQASAPAHPPAVAGDVWYDSDDNNKSYQSDGATWQPLVTSISGSLVVNGTIVGDHIAANTLTANKMNISELSAVSANLGTVTSGLFKTTSGSGYRAELGEDGGYVLWYGTGAKTDVNSKFHVKTDGSASFSGTLDANVGTLSSIEFTSKLWMGTSTWNTGEGFWAGFDGGVVKAQIGDIDTGQYLTWDGTALHIQGDVYLKNFVAGTVYRAYNWNLAGADSIGDNTFRTVKNFIFDRYGTVRLEIDYAYSNAANLGPTDVAEFRLTADGSPISGTTWSQTDVGSGTQIFSSFAIDPTVEYGVQIRHNAGPSNSGFGHPVASVGVMEVWTDFNPNPRPY